MTQLFLIAQVTNYKNIFTFIFNGDSSSSALFLELKNHESRKNPIGFTNNFLNFFKLASNIIFLIP